MKTVLSVCFEKCGFQELSVCHASGCPRNTMSASQPHKIVKQYSKCICDCSYWVVVVVVVL